MKKILGNAFWARPAVTVAKELVGATLVRKDKKSVQRWQITEVEAYTGPKDLACHASRGRTSRTEVMFSAGGHLYVYFIYGMYWMLNVVTGPENYPAAVLIRGIEGVKGPGRVTKALKIDSRLNGKRAIPKNGLWFEKSDKPPIKIKRTARIGVDYAGPIWSKKKYRFTVYL